MSWLVRVPFRTGFYCSVAIAALVFLFANLFAAVDPSFFQTVRFYKGFNLLVGVEGRRFVILEPQFAANLVVTICLVSCVVAALKGAWRFKFIGIAGVLSAVLLVVQAGSIEEFSATPAYYLLILITLASTVHAWAHALVPAEKIAAEGERN